MREAYRLNKERKMAVAQDGGEVEYEFGVWQDDSLQAGGSTSDYATAKSEADHYALMYGQDGPVEVRVYEKRRITAPPNVPEREVYFTDIANRAQEITGRSIWPSTVKAVLEAFAAILTSPPSTPVGGSLLQTALRNLPQYISKSGLDGPDMHSAMQCFEVLHDALAQRPAPVAPVGVEELACRIENYHWDVADKPVAAKFAAELRNLAQQPAAVADATVARLTKDQRTRLVEKLVADQVEGADRMSSYLWGVLKNGFRGYSNYTDQELLDAHWGAFDEDFFGLESGDDQ